MAAILFLVLLTAAAMPWVAGIAWAWSRRPRDGWIPPSAGEQALRRLTAR